MALCRGKEGPRHAERDAGRLRDRAALEAGAEAGVYLEEISKTDIATLDAGEWREFLRRLFVGYELALRRKILEQRAAVFRFCIARWVPMRSAPRFIERGFAAVPIMPGTKRPGFFFAGMWIGLANWQRRFNGVRRRAKQPNRQNVLLRSPAGDRR